MKAPSTLAFVSVVLVYSSKASNAALGGACCSASTLEARALLALLEYKRTNTGAFASRVTLCTCCTGTQVQVMTPEELQAASKISLAHTTDTVTQVHTSSLSLSLSLTHTHTPTHTHIWRLPAKSL
jgi:hypothetical protein